tara:strand:- start:75875 stop:76087 length:213 start_codon:yes stop_codon:yes gene_type:complete
MSRPSKEINVYVSNIHYFHYFLKNEEEDYDENKHDIYLNLEKYGLTEDDLEDEFFQSKLRDATIDRILKE